MYRMHRYLGSLVLGVALIAPVGLQASSRQSSQDADMRPASGRSTAQGNTKYRSRPSHHFLARQCAIATTLVTLDTLLWLLRRQDYP